MDSGIGRPVPRREDLRLLTGQGRYSDDVNLAGQAYAVMVRSPHGHARIRRIAIETARAAKGVLLVLTGAEFKAEGLKGAMIRSNPEDVPLRNVDGSQIWIPLYTPIAIDKARRVGEVVAVVVAGTPAQARDGAELVEVDYEVLPAVTDPFAAAAKGAPAVWDELPGNVCVDDIQGDKAATDAAFARAAHVIEIAVMNNRMISAFMDPRGATAHWDDKGKLTLYAGNQAANRVQQGLAGMFGLSPVKVRVLAGDVGGGFGTRGGLYPEFGMVAWAALKLGRPVKWTSERTEAFISDNQARDLHTSASLAFDADGKILGMRAENMANLGCHAISLTPLARGVSVTTGVYDIPALTVRSRAAYTNCVPIATFRGAGRPEAMYLLERLIDKAARVLKMDPVAIRKRNLISPAALPYRNPLGMTYDSGDFAKSMDMALHLGDWNSFAARRAAAKARGKLAGIGIANYIETATGQPIEWTEVEVTSKGAGSVEVRIGTQDSGQGHDTSFSQLLVEWLGVPFDQVHVTEGDTDIIPKGAGSHSSRSMRLAGYLIGKAKDNILDKGKRIAAHKLEAAIEDIEYTNGRFRVAGTDRALTLFEAAATAEGDASLPTELRGKLSDIQEINRQIVAFPNGCHVCEIEVDPDTGEVRITRYAAIDDVGRVINPLLVDGQTHGGIAHGAGQALFERVVWDDNGQLLSGSFMDYCLPKADLLPSFACENNENLSTSNPLGIKGAGEGGATGAPPAIINAVLDALAPLGVTHIDMPATPETVWRAIKSAKGV